MNKKLLSLYGLKWNPFAPDVPTEALYVSPRLENFGWRVENLAREGGFALVTGEPGLGKSVSMRALVERLAAVPDAKVGVLTRPQAGLADFFREMGDLFGVQLQPHNRWAGSKLLREKWQAHVDASLFRPILVIDEAQEMQTLVLNELRLLSSTRLDSQFLLTTIVAGDGRLLERFRRDELLPVGSRIRARLTLERATPGELLDLLKHALARAGNPKLMTTELMTTLAEHGAGNARTMMNMAAELLAAGAHRELKQLDEKLYFDVFAPPSSADGAKAPASARRR
jgi:type II secretory pathway predicted ATPase ExeA